MINITILKIGGNVLDDSSLLAIVLDSFAAMKEYKILIHGGGKIANVMMKTVDNVSIAILLYNLNRVLRGLNT